MMYSNKLAVAVKSAGKVLREFKDTVYIPFGSEYSILIKNLESVRSLVKVSIDGQYIDDGSGFVVYGNNEIELERFLKNGNWDCGNRLKFIERTGRIEQHRGVKIEDGLIRIEFQFEKRYPKTYPPYIPWKQEDQWPKVYRCFTPQNSGFRGILDTSHTVSGTAQGSSEDFFFAARSDGRGSKVETVNLVNTTNGGEFSNAEEQVLLSNVADSAPVNDVGITVEGSISNQKFVRADWFATEDEKHVIVLKLLGETGQGKRVRQAVTVKHKPKCKTCGHVNKAHAKFCSNCGTSLVIV